MIRIEGALRDAFMKRSDQMDTSAAREVRRFMRDWVEKRTPAPKAVSTVEPATEANPKSSAFTTAAEATTKAGHQYLAERRIGNRGLSRLRYKTSDCPRRVNKDAFKAAGLPPYEVPLDL